MRSCIQVHKHDSWLTVRPITMATMVQAQNLHLCTLGTCLSGLKLAIDMPIPLQKVTFTIAAKLDVSKQLCAAFAKADPNWSISVLQASSFKVLPKMRSARHLGGHTNVLASGSVIGLDAVSFGLYKHGSAAAYDDQYGVSILMASDGG